LWAAAEFLWPFVNQGAVLRVAAAALAVVVFAFIGVCVDRNRDWQDNQTIYAATLDRNPNTIRVNYNLAVTYEDIVDNRPGARRHFERVLTLYDEKRAREGTPENAYWADEYDARLSLGRLHLDDGRFDLAFAQFVPLVQLASSVKTAEVAARAAMGLAICYVATSQTPRGLDLVQKIARTDQLPSASAYFRRTFVGNRRIADQMQVILMRISVLQQVQQSGGQTNEGRPAVAPEPVD